MIDFRRSVRAGILGVGAVGARVARHFLSANTSSQVVLGDPDIERVERVASELGTRVDVVGKGTMYDAGVDVIIVAAPCGRHLGAVSAAVRARIPVVSVSDRVEDVEGMFALDQKARSAGVPVIVGAGFAPGMTCLLAAYGARSFDVVDEVHIAKAGTGGPACARQHHRALKGMARDWRDGGWIRRPGGSGRELVWFPDPVGGADCYRGSLPDALVLREGFLEARRLTARVAATRQDRFTSWLPMLTPPHPEGGVGAIRVELRGRVDDRREIRILGAVERPAIAAAAVAARAGLVAALALQTCKGKQCSD